MLRLALLRLISSYFKILYLSLPDLRLSAKLAARVRFQAYQELVGQIQSTVAAYMVAVFVALYFPDFNIDISDDTRQFRNSCAMLLSVAVFGPWGYLSIGDLLGEPRSLTSRLPTGSVKFFQTHVQPVLQVTVSHGLASIATLVVLRILELNGYVLPSVSGHR